MKPLTIGQVAKLAGVGVETMRFYERNGLVDEPPRNEAGYRQYPEDTPLRVRFIRHAKDLGFSLKEIQDLLSLKMGPDTTCSDVRRVARMKLENIEARIIAMKKMKMALSKLVEACAGIGPVGECPILDAIEPDWDITQINDVRRHTR